MDEDTEPDLLRQELEHLLLIGGLHKKAAYLTRSEWTMKVSGLDRLVERGLMTMRVPSGTGNGRYYQLTNKGCRVYSRVIASYRGECTGASNSS